MTLALKVLRLLSVYVSHDIVHIILSLLYKILFKPMEKTIHIMYGLSAPDNNNALRINCGLDMTTELCGGRKTELTCTN